MPFASHEISMSRQWAAYNGGIRCVMVLLLTSGWAMLGNPAKSQDPLIIGSGQPQIHINEEAAYLRTYQPRNVDMQRPLFDPTKDTLQSRVIYLPPATHKMLKPQTQSTTPGEKRLPTPVAVTAVEINKKEIIANPSPQSIPVTEQAESDSSLEERDSPGEQAQPSPPIQEPSEKELAAIPPNQPDIINEPGPGNTRSITTDPMTIIFNSGEKDIREEEAEKLVILAGELLRNDATRLQLRAYASDTDESASAARRLSLARALAVRSFLIETGVNSTRIDVRALGAKNELGPADRVDLVVAH